MTTATKMFGRRTLLAGAGAAGVAAVTGCGRQSAPGGGGGLTGTLQIWGGVPPENGPTALCKAYEAARPGTKITYTRFVNDVPGNVKLDTALAGTTPIDLYFSYGASYLFKRASSGLAVDLSEKLTADADLKGFAPGAAPVNNLLVNGKAFSAPAQKGPTLVFLNETLLDKAGIKLGDSWTFAEFTAIAQELTRDGVLGTMPFQTTTMVRPKLTLGPNFNYQEGGKKSNFQHPTFAEELRYRLELQSKKIALDHKTILAEKLEAYPQSAFISGRVAAVPVEIFVVRYIANLKEYPHDFRTRVMPYPTLAPGGDKWNMANIGDHLSINPKSQRQELAWDFLKFWLVEGGKYMITGSRIPSIVGKATPAELTAALLGPDRDKIFNVASFEQALFGKKLEVPIDTVFNASSEIFSLQKRYTDELLLGTKTVEAWVEGMTKDADAAISAAK